MEFEILTVEDNMCKYSLYYTHRSQKVQKEEKAKKAIHLQQTMKNCEHSHFLKNIQENSKQEVDKSKKMKKQCK